MATNEAVHTYAVSGVGVPNAYGLVALGKARIAVNTTFTSMLEIRNPFNRSLQIVEAYTSDDDLHVDVPAADLSLTHLNLNLSTNSSRAQRMNQTSGGKLKEIWVKIISL